MPYILLFSFGLVYSNNSIAEVQFGIGSRIATILSIGSNGLIGSYSTITIPAKVNKSVLIEPEITFSNMKQDRANGGKSEETIQGLIVGIFKYSKSNRSIKPYYGARIGLVKYITEQTNPTNGVVDSSSITVNYISPTYGAEVEIINNFTIAGEIGLTYIKSDTEQNINTESRLMARFLF